MGAIENEVKEWTKKISAYQLGGRNQFSIAATVFDSCKDDFERYGVIYVSQGSMISLSFKSANWDISIDPIGQISVNGQGIQHDEVIGKVREIISAIALKIAEEIVTEQNHA